MEPECVLSGHSGLPAVRQDRALMHSRVQVRGRPHPFKSDIREGWVDAGQSIVACLEAAGVPVLAQQETLHVWLNGVFVEPADWRRVRPKAGTRLTYRVVPRGGLFRTILILGITIAAIAASVLTAGTLTPVFGAAWAGVVGSLAGAAVSASGSV
jgi:hypothetical protein